MSDAAAEKQPKGLIASEHAESWTCFKWLLPVLFIVFLAIGLLIHYWTFLKTDGATYIPVGFAIVLSSFLSMNGGDKAKVQGM